MFGIFKKKASAPSLELSDDDLDLIHGGRPPSDMDSAPASTPHVRSFDARDAVVAVVGRTDWRSAR